MPRPLTELAAQIRLLLMDVDGVLTDGKAYNVPDAAGNMVETKGFDTQDGISLQWLSWKGFQTGVISGRVSPATEDARQAMQHDLRLSGPSREDSDPGGDPGAVRHPRASQVAYIGDDLTDVVVMNRVGLECRAGQCAAGSEARARCTSPRSRADKGRCARFASCCSRRRDTGTICCGSTRCTDERMSEPSESWWWRRSGPACCTN